MKSVIRTLILCFFSTVLFPGCNDDCYNPSLEQQYANTECSEDCPGVTGCDGKTYCNECEANRLGVAVDN